MNKQNPYESPRSPDRPKGSLGRKLAAVALGILSIPAAAIAFFTTCLMTYEGTRLEVFPWIVGAIAAVAVGGPFIYVIIRLLRR